MSGNSQSRRRNEYFQEDWEEFGLPNEKVSSQVELRYQQQQQQVKKKRFGGNRKLQRFRAKLRKQGLDHESIATMVNEYNNPTRPDSVTEEDVIQVKADKRKRESRLMGVTMSASHVTIAQPSTKRQRSTTFDNIAKQKDVDEPQCNSMPKYLNMPDSVFKNMLSTSLEGADNIVQSLDTSAKLHFTRVYAQLVNNLFYLKLKQDFWSHYCKVIISEGIWSLTMSKQMVKENNLHRFQFMTQAKLETRQKAIIEQIEETENELNKHKQLAVEHSFDINRLLTIIPAFVRKGQHKLAQDFERKKLLLQLDAKEYRLVQHLLDLNPSDEQIHSARLIWQTTADKQSTEEHVAILKQRIYSKRWPPSFNLLDHSVDNIEKMLARQPILDKNKRTTLLDERSKIIAKYKFDMMTLTIRTGEEIVRRHVEIITNEKKKLTGNTNQQGPLPKSLVTILNAIAARQSDIIKRAQIVTKQKISFFDDAPTVMEEARTVGATF